MLRYISLALPIFLLIIANGCATIEVSREVQWGRSALKLGQPKAALAHFEAAAAQDPNYTTRFTLLNSGIWSYVGRTYYALGEKEQALAKLKRAKESSSNDYVGRIYLGLVMAQTGETQEGKAELTAGLKGLAAWLEGLPGMGERGQYWDPQGRIANGIVNLLNMVQMERPDWQSVTTLVEWLGNTLEEEIEEAKNDRENHDLQEAGED